MGGGISILELGFGNGLLLKKIYKKYKVKKYVGIEFIEQLIKECRINFKYKNVFFKNLDLTLINKSTLNEKFDYIISKKTIQNVLTHNAQLKIIDNCGYFLNNDGLMMLIESSKNGQTNLNFLRKKFKLSKLSPPSHNLFLDDQKIKDYNYKNLKLLKIENFTSDFYFITRILYALYAKIFLRKNTRDNHPLNVIASKINSNFISKDLSQVKAFIFKKKINKDL
jgi:cyclopropane fatty-acyl-phospholipid synthase-like methyltransferase